MTYRSIFVHVDDTGPCASRLDIATRLARAYPARLLGAYLMPAGNVRPFASVMLPEEVVQRRLQENNDLQHDAEARFRAAAENAGVTSVDWHAPAGDPLEAAILHARYADLAVVGPLARSAEDLRLALDVIAGPDTLARDGWTLALPASRAGRLEGFRVGFWLDDPLCPVGSETRTELEATIDALRPHVKLVEVELPFDLAAITPLYTQLLLGVIGTDMPTPLKWLTRALRPHYALSERLGVPTNLIRKNAARGMHLSHADWNRAHEGRTRLRWQCRELFRDIDVLLTPVSPFVPFPHQTGGNHLSRRIVVDGQKRAYLDHLPWIALATSAFLPATSAPVGMTQEGLPVNIQIIGPYLGDHTTIRFAELMAKVRGGFEPPPPPH